MEPFVAFFAVAVIHNDNTQQAVDGYWKFYWKSNQDESNPWWD